MEIPDFISLLAIFLAFFSFVYLLILFRVKRKSGNLVSTVTYLSEDLRAKYESGVHTEHGMVRGKGGKVRPQRKPSQTLLNSIVQ